MKHPVKSHCKSSIPFWDPNLTIDANASRLNINISYAYVFAYRHRLKFKYSFTAGQKALNKAMLRDNPYNPSKQKMTWEDGYENLLNEERYG